MGLDNFASRSKEKVLLSEEDLQAFIDADLDLWAGYMVAELAVFAVRCTIYCCWMPPR